MEQHTKPGTIVLEPFSGSGSQLLAAKKIGRRCRAMEISPAFVDVAIKRWETATGKSATLNEPIKPLRKYRLKGRTRVVLADIHSRSYRSVSKHQKACGLLLYLDLH